MKEERPPERLLRPERPFPKFPASGERRSARRYVLSGFFRLIRPIVVPTGLGDDEPRDAPTEPATYGITAAALSVRLVVASARRRLPPRQIFTSGDCVRSSDVSITRPAVGLACT
jgi:hypothetical protein